MGTFLGAADDPVSSGVTWGGQGVVLGVPLIWGQALGSLGDTMSPSGATQRGSP